MSKRKVGSDPEKRKMGWHKRTLVALEGK